MQIATAHVRHKGSLNSVVRKRNLTPAEVVVLQRIHSPDAVVDVVLQSGQSDNDNTTEIDRLRATYGTTKDGAKTLEELFPGHAPKLPTSFKEIGIDAAPPVKASGRKTIKDDAPAADPAASVLE